MVLMARQKLARRPTTISQGVGSPWVTTRGRGPGASLGAGTLSVSCEAVPRRRKSGELNGSTCLLIAFYDDLGVELKNAVIIRLAYRSSSGSVLEKHR